MPMADENKIERDSEELENLPPEELQKRIQEEKKNARRSLRLAFTALIAIIAVCIAWFAANNQVTMNSTQITAETTEPFEIASVGSRLDDEEKYFKDENNKSILSGGTEKNTYKEYIDIETGVSTESVQKYYVGGSGIAWHMNNSNQSLVPGAGGKLEFYIIPKQTNLNSVTITLNMEGYTLDETTTNPRAEKLDNPKIQSLINGHILLFRHLDDKYGYYGWLGESHTLKIDAPERPEGNTFVPNIPYKVTLYWKWPQYFRNYIYTQRSTYGDLFTDDMINDETYGKDYKLIINFINEQKEVTSDTSKLFYAAKENETKTEAQVSIKETIDKDMSDTTLDACSTYYNQADEYIGKNTQYVYIQIKID